MYQWVVVVSIGFKIPYLGMMIQCDEHIFHGGLVGSTTETRS